MKRVLLLLCLCMGSALSAQTGQDTSMTDQLQTVEISNDRLAADVITLSRKQFLTMAGALEDPTRLLIKSPGISTANDQANSIIYHGMPSHYHQWSLYGARMVNPNHLSNAGTISDFPSRSAGGVNMLSGQVIGGLSFAGAPSRASLGTTAGLSDISLRTPFKSGLTTNMSLIGLEAGYDHASEGSNLMLNYRYSTVGLLTGLGLDFGGEVINYQDLSGKYSITSGTGQYDFYFSLGANSNSKTALDSAEIEVYKDRQAIDYDGLIGVLGVHHLVKRGRATYHTTINASQRSEDRLATAPLADLSADTVRYDGRERMISLYQSRTVAHEKWSWATTVEAWLQQIHTVRRYPIGEEGLGIEKSLDKTSLYAIPRVSIDYGLTPTWSVGGTLGAMVEFSDATYVRPVGQMTIRYSEGPWTMDLKASRSAQARSPELIADQYTDRAIDGTHVSASVRYGGLGLTGYWHRVDGVAMADSAYGFISLQNLDRLPITRSEPGAIVSGNLTAADIYGVTASYGGDILGFNIQSNITLQSSAIRGGSSADQRAPLDYGYLGNVSIGRAWKLRGERRIGLSMAYHHRGGERQYAVDRGLSYDWGYTNYALATGLETQLAAYYRADLRIYYQPSSRATVSLDIQNVTNRENDAFLYYEPETGQSALQRQLGMIPILSWRVQW